jgi:ABC-type oligopeptide transport system substrate-binding subunit
VPTDATVLLIPEVRQALSLAIDRQYINDQVFSGIHVPAYGIVPFGIPGAAAGKDYRSEADEPMSDDFTADVAKAKELLAAAGYPDGAGFPVLEYTYNTNSTHQAVAEAIQKSWKENLNIEITLAPMEWADFSGFRKTDDCEIARQGWTGDYVDPATFFDLFITGAGTNDSKYSNPQYDQLVNDARSEQDPAKRSEMYHQAEQILVGDDAGVIPIVYQQDEALVKTDLTGYATTPTGNRIFFGANKPEIVVNVGSEPETLDPGMNQTVDGFIYATQTYESIYRYAADGSLVLGQAASCDYDAATNTLNIVLRDGIQWSDGKPVKAGDFVYAWKRMMDPATASPYSYVFGDLFKNGNDVLAGTTPAADLSVTAADDTHITIEVGKLPGYYKDLLAFPESQPVREDVVSKNPTGWATEPVVTNGRYVIKTFAHEDKIVMEKNAKYWDAATTLVNKITFVLSDDDASLLASFKNGDIDFLDSVLVDERATLKETPEYKLFPSLSIYYIQMNNSPTVK